MSPFLSEAILVASNGRILRAACNAYSRRYFEDASDYPADRKKWLTWFQQLFDVNAREVVLSAQAEHRHSEAKPIGEPMRTELDSIGARTEQVELSKSDFRKALNYLSNHWTELTR